ncbi:putative ribonuclease H-like domain-containing protein [Tanacetum coccineum]
MKKMYCLVVIDDYSRFSWVFFLATKDETSEILKTFITCIENLIDLEVKVIRCDNRTEFKNRVMNQLCEIKGIKREFSVARTPQQNGVAKMKNRTLIEATRTMLANSKLPTTFWAEAVNTACYVQNRVSVIKPHNKTPYELFLGYSTNNKAFWVFTIELDRKKEPACQLVVAGNQSNGIAGTKACENDGFKPIGEEEKKSVEHPENEDCEVPNKKEPRVNQEKDESVNSTNNINNVSLTINTASIEDNIVDENIVYGSVDDLNMPNLEEIVYSEDDEDVGAEADMTNLDMHIPVSPIPTTKIHKDHPVEQIIEDIHSAPQTRNNDKEVCIDQEDLDFSYLPYGKGPLDQNGSTKQERCKESEELHFGYGNIKERTCVCSPLGFEDPEFSDRVYKYPKDSPFDLEAYTDSDYAGASLDRKSITGGCQFLGRRLISWQCKKQTIVTNSTTEAEYVVASSCCGHVLWIQNQLLDYGYNFMNTKIFIDNESIICIVKNLVFHSKTKHIEIRHHFIKDSYEKRLIQVIKIHTDHNVADLLTKAFDIDDWNGLEMLRMKLVLKLCCQAKVNTARLLTTTRLPLELQLLRQLSLMEALKFVDSHNMVAYLEKSPENADFDEIVDFLNANPIRYALTVSPTIYVSYIEQFWSTIKIKIVNNERKILAKVNGKTIVISESSMRRDLQFNDEDGIACLTNTEIFENLQLMGYENLSDRLNYDIPSHTKKVFANMKRKGKDFSGTMAPLFATMLIQPQEDVGKGSRQPTEPQHTPTTASPSNIEPIPIIASSSSQPRKTHKRRKTKRPTEISQS